MSDSQDGSPGDDYFNDLNQQPRRSEASDRQRRGSPDDGTNGGIPKPKRIACVVCRKRKLRCDGGKPSCASCTRLQHDCSYNEIRRKSGPKRGYVKALEARLAQFETLLKTQDEPQPTSQPAQRGGTNGQATAGPVGNGMLPEYDAMDLGGGNIDLSNQSFSAEQAPFSNAMLGNNVDLPAEEPFPWEMIGLGLDEPLPNQDVVNELNQAYFDKIHPSLPMIHRPRYYAAMNLAPHVRPPVCLRYAMWALAASVTEKYEQLQEHFYTRARKYIQQDEMKGHGESMITVAHAQTWILLGTYEFKWMYFPRAWMSAGRACRMTQMMGLHRLDGARLDVKQCLPPPRDWTEREERRRTFWMSFAIDRYSSIGTGWPMTIDEKDIMSNLPCDEDAFELSKGGTNISLNEALKPGHTDDIFAFGGVTVMACLYGRNLTHLHRPSPDDEDANLDGQFWKRHRDLDNILLNLALALPDHLRMPSCMNQPNAVFLNMCIHTSTICLHQAAIFKADRNRMPARISAESKVRCITAAAETASIMRQTSHLDLSAMNPFISFSLYVAARVFVQYLKSRPSDVQVRASLQFLLQAMQAIKRKNPLAESFLVQLDVDLESVGLNEAVRNKASNNLPGHPTRSEGCPVSQLGIGERTTPSYNDIGVAVGTAAYTDTSAGMPVSAAAAPHHTFADNTLPGFAANGSPMSFNLSQYDLPSRHRSPGSNQDSNTHMDMSSDGGGGGSGDLRTPASNSSSGHSQHTSNLSAQTSNTGYSPASNGTGNNQNLHRQHRPQSQPDPGGLVGFFGPNDSAFSGADFDLPAFTSTTTNSSAALTAAMGSQEQGFVLSSTEWGGGGGGEGAGGGGGTGFTPGPSAAFTPGAFGGNEMLNLSEADWNSFMEGMAYSPFVSGGEA